MSIDSSDGIEPGNLRIKIVTTNDTSVTLPTDQKFGGMVIQPGSAATAFEGEHGLGVYIEINDDSTTHGILFDTGGTNATILHNIIPMNVKLETCEHVIISHGHYDHFGSLEKIIPLLPETCDIVIHPSSFIQNQYVVTRTGDDIPVENFDKTLREMKKSGKVTSERKFQVMSKKTIESLAVDRGVKLVETTEPMVLYPGVVTSGEIELFDPSEVTGGFYLLAEKKHVEKHDFQDEIALYLNIKGKGLVVLTGCGHRGINNTIRHGQKVTGIEQIHAVIGGFHTEMSNASHVGTVVEQIDAFNPRIVCGMHCTGIVFQAKMLGHDSHVQGVVGTEFHF